MTKKIICVFGGLILFFILISSMSSSDTEITENKTESREAVVEEVPVVTVGSEIITTNLASQNQNQTANQTYYLVVDVIDGDTIKISINEKDETLRLIGLDTPETVDPRKPVQCFGKEASDKAKELLLEKKIRIESDVSQDVRDKYGRLLVYVYREDGLFYNKYMIEQGYAHEYTYKIPYKYQSEFKVAEISAKTNQKGLWAPTVCNDDTISSILYPNQTSPVDTNYDRGKYYTSSYHSSKYYYPEACDGWKSLKPENLKSFNSLEELLSKYDRILSPAC